MDSILNIAIVVTVAVLMIGGIVLFVRKCAGDENAD